MFTESTISHPTDTRVLRRVEGAVRDFFQEQFDEKPTVLRLGYRGETIRVYGTRPTVLAEMQLRGNAKKTKQLQRYHRAVFKTVEKELHKKLNAALNGTIGSVECTFDPAKREFEIVFDCVGSEWIGSSQHVEHFA